MKASTNRSDCRTIAKNSIKGSLINLVSRGDRSFETQEVLKDISFQIKKGEFFGIVGRNGSGKSTLLKMLAGIYTPTADKIITNGSLTPFIELGVGFNPELTGRENVFLNGALLGFSKRSLRNVRWHRQIRRTWKVHGPKAQKLPGSGIQVRLAFSIAIRAKSDILLLDEVLAVGDAAFQAKCFNYFYELKKNKATVVFVSHDRGSLERFCTNGILIDKGEIIKNGHIRNVSEAYSDVVIDQMNSVTKKTKVSAPKEIKLEKAAQLIEARVVDAETGETIQLILMTNF